MSLSIWTLRSYLPGTREHDLYRDVTAWISESVEWLQTLAPEIPDPPKVPRTEQGLVWIMETMLPILEGAKAGSEGNRALMEEFLT